MAAQLSSHSNGSVKVDASIAIVSAFGRGHWLALELVRRGWRVTLVDVSEALGDGTGSDRLDDAMIDAEGPFGLFEADDLEATMLSRLIAEGSILQVEQGFTLWLEDGPIEMRSPLGEARLKSLGISDACLQYVRRTSRPDRDSEKLARSFVKAPFKENWLAHFAHLLTSVTHAENHRGVEHGTAAPLTVPFSIRQASLHAHQISLAKCIDGGVTLRKQALVRDLRFDGSANVDALEIGDDRAGIERAKAFVWTLTSAESERFPKNLFKNLFPGGSAQPKWYWQRLRFQLDGERPDDALPAHAVLIRDPFLSWTHDNLVILRKHADARAYDVWLRLPMHARQDEKYLLEMSQSVAKLLEKRMPEYLPRIVAPPRARALGVAPRVPVFDQVDLSGLERMRASNFFFCGPEKWATHDWLGQYRAQIAILAKLDKLKAQWDAAARKQALKEAST